MSDTFIDMSDELGVLVIVGEPEDEDTWAEIANPLTYARVIDPNVGAEARPHLTDCTVILTAL